MPNGEPRVSAAQVVASARQYLLSFSGEGVTEEVLACYLESTQEDLRPKDINGIYERLLSSSMNSNMKRQVVNGTIGGIWNLRAALCGFDPAEVKRKFGGDASAVLDAIEQEVPHTKEIRRSPRSIFVLLSRAIVTGADFLSDFSDADGFYEWVDTFDGDDRLRAALPTLLSDKIAGYGFALGCDFLKGLGYLDFAKPDVHIKAIVSGLGFTPPYPSDYAAFKAVIRIASETGLSPYYVDKLLWLVGSGYFYSHPEVGHGGRIGRHASDFVSSFG